MQETIFYVAAGETLGSVRDLANAKTMPAPTLVRGVSALLRMRLFAHRDGLGPYPIDALDGIVRWQWAMDTDFNEATAYKLQADNAAIEISVRSFYKQEKLIHKAFGTLESRLNRYTQPCDRAFVDRIIARKPKTMRELNEAWFGEYRPTFAHYDSHRYHSLNISPLFETKRTVEFRFGNGTCHAGEARAMAIFCLAMVAKAKLARAASGRNPREYNETSICQIGFHGIKRV